MSLLTLLLYGSIGCLEWALALTRTIYTIKKNAVIVPITVFIEMMVALLVFKDFIMSGNWAIALAYSLGSALGSVIPMIYTKRKDEAED